MSSSTIPIRSSTFSQVQLHGRLRRYRLPLHVCRLLHDQLVVDEATGEVRCRDYVEDDRCLAALFEAFVRNMPLAEVCARHLVDLFHRLHTDGGRRRGGAITGPARPSSCAG